MNSILDLTDLYWFFINKIKFFFESKSNFILYKKMCHKSYFIYYKLCETNPFPLKELKKKN